MRIGRDAADVVLDGAAPVFILGPCVIESEELTWQLARDIKEMADKEGYRIVFKASYDKANRTSVDAYRGPGIEEGLRILAAVKRETGLALLTDVHEACQVGRAAEVVDVLQIPAFLCRQTDLLVEAGRSGRAVNIKKAQFLAPPGHALRCRQSGIHWERSDFVD